MAKKKKSAKASSTSPSGGSTNFTAAEDPFAIWAYDTIERILVYANDRLKAEANDSHKAGNYRDAIAR